MITEMDIITILGLVRVNCQHDKVMLNIELDY